MGKVKVKLNSPGMKSLLNDADVRDDLTTRMERVLATAKANAPVRSGNYRDGLEVVQDSTDRVVVRIVGRAPHSHLIESRTGNLARALDSAGGG